MVRLVADRGISSIRSSARLSAAAGYPRDEITVTPITMDDMRKGCWDQKARLEDMDVNHVEASLAFPSFPRFCGQTFLERKDKELADLCVKAYNDWMVDEWCAGTNGRLIPLIIVQLWDAQLAAARSGAMQLWLPCSHVLEIPPFLGFPSIHDKDGYWDPFLAACEETDTVINMHIGSSSKMPSTSADAPAAVGSTLTYMNAAMSLTDWLMSGVFEAVPRLTIAASEGQIGWIPYVLGRRKQGVGQPRLGRRRRQGQAAVQYYYTEHVVRELAHDDGTACARSSSASTTSRSRPTIRTATPPGRKRKVAEELMKDLHAGTGEQGLCDKRDPDAPPRPAWLSGMRQRVRLRRRSSEEVEAEALVGAMRCRRTRNRDSTDLTAELSSRHAEPDVVGAEERAHSHRRFRLNTRRRRDRRDVERAGLVAAVGPPSEAVSQPRRAARRRASAGPCSSMSP